MDALLLADDAELICRWVLATLFIPEQTEAFWADLHAGFVEEIEMYLKACAVMADAAQPIGTES
ncbi:hypothetical protein [Nocardia sp. Marseille-Q1738]